MIRIPMICDPFDMNGFIQIKSVFSESLEARCQVENEDVVGAAPTGDAPTTSEWSTIQLPTKVRLILETWRYSSISLLEDFQVPMKARWPRLNNMRLPDNNPEFILGMKYVNRQ